MTELLRLDWSSDDDVFMARQRGREVAAALGAARQDQTRVATALSEVGRDLLSSDPISVAFAVSDTPPRLVVTVTTRRSPPAEDDAAVGLAAARRLLDEVSVAQDEGVWSIRLVKRLPGDAPTGLGALRRVRAALRGAQDASPIDELRAQNSELVQALEELTDRQQDLLRLNAELEDTNRGVLAMYGQLSSELEQTNRGVVALYAELDEKGRQLLDANEAKSRFLRNVSHELRTPVNSIIGLADLLAAEVLSSEQRTQVDFLQCSARSLLGLVNELLDLARAESGRVDVRVAETDLRQLFGELGGTLRPVAEDVGVSLVVDDPNVGALHTDAELLTRVLRNLVMNGLKFTQTGGRVRLSAQRRESGQHVEIAVADTGVGIAPEHQAQVFEEFFQVPGQLQAQRPGTGLGLPYARRVVEALGGTLALESTVGAGSTFTVVLPAVVEEALSDADADADIHVGHVLVVDDDAAFRHVVRGMLQGAATRVSEAADGDDALHLIREVPPDVMLLDLRMPRLDGAEVLSELYADPRLRELPVVLMTSVAIDAEVRRTAKPAAGLLAKSELTRHHLLTVLHGALARGDFTAESDW